MLVYLQMIVNLFSLFLSSSHKPLLLVSRNKAPICFNKLYYFLTTKPYTVSLHEQSSLMAMQSLGKLH